MKRYSFIINESDLDVSDTRSGAAWQATARGKSPEEAIGMCILKISDIVVDRTDRDIPVYVGIISRDNTISSVVPYVLNIRWIGDFPVAYALSHSPETEKTWR